MSTMSSAFDAEKAQPSSDDSNEESTETTTSTTSFKCSTPKKKQKIQYLHKYQSKWESHDQFRS